MHEGLAASYAQLGEHEAASQVLREVFGLNPGYAGMCRERLEKWFDPELVEHFMEGLRKAGLQTLRDPAKSDAAGISPPPAPPPAQPALLSEKKKASGSPCCRSSTREPMLI